MDQKLFNELSRPSQIQYIIDEGEIIQEIQKRHLYTSLFLLGNFYVEIFLNVLSNEIVRIQIQNDPNKLYPYIKHLSLNEPVFRANQ